MRNFLEYLKDSINKSQDPELTYQEIIKDGKYFSGRPNTFDIMHAAAIFDIKEVLEKGISLGFINQLDSAGKAPIHYACFKHSYSAINILTENGASFSEDEKGYNPLDYLVNTKTDNQSVEKDIDSLKIIFSKSSNSREIAEQTLESFVNPDEKLKPIGEFLEKYLKEGDDTKQNTR
jgi:ankyrin repeat protein